MLELCFGAPSIFAGFIWPGELGVTCVLQGESLDKSHELLANTEHPRCIADYRKPLPFAARSFDIVILHETIDRLINADHEMKDADVMLRFISRIREILADGGVLAGCFANRTGISRWGNVLRTQYAESNASKQGAFTVGSCRELLGRSGFSRVQTYNVVPDAMSPSRLINTDADLSRLGFRRELEAARPSLSLLGYLARRTLVELALNRYLEDSIMFWGCRE